MLYEALRENYGTGTKKVVRTENGLIISHGNKQLSVSPFEIRLKRDDGTYLRRKISPDRLLYVCACLRVAGSMKYNFVYRINEGLSLKYRGHKFKVIFLNENDKAEEVFPLYSEPVFDFDHDGKRYYLLPLHALRVIFELEELIRDFPLTVEGITGRIHLTKEGMTVESPAGAVKIGYGDIPPPATMLLLGARNSFIREIALGKALLYKTEAEVHISRKGMVMFSGSLFDAQALLSGLRSKLFLP